MDIFEALFRAGYICCCSQFDMYDVRAHLLSMFPLYKPPLGFRVYEWHLIDRDLVVSSRTAFR